jgi:hypothetical protein
VPTPHLTPAQPPAPASKAYLRAFSDLRAIARDFEVPGRKERVVQGTHVDIPGVRTSSARSGIDATVVYPLSRSVSTIPI